MINVFYRPEQSVASNKSYSPSAGKPALVFDDWTSNKEIAPFVKVRSFDPLTVEQIAVAHDLSYVKGIFDGSIPNGFNNTSKEVAESLKYTTGSMFAAAKFALDTDTPAFSLTSGFHHAGYNHGGGFCTFNGLMITAILLKQAGLVNKVAILDFDQHYGDGTQDIIDKLGIDWIKHITAMKSYETADEALKACSSGKIKDLKHKYDLVLFQAGADIHVDDPLGGILTTEQMRQRDENIIRTCFHYGIPLVINLAGGYQTDDKGTIEPVLALHRQTAQVWIDVAH